LSRSLSARSISMYLPWRTPPTPAKPREPSAWAIALPCGSRTPPLSVIWTLAFTKSAALSCSARFRQLSPAIVAQSLHDRGALEIGRARLGHDAETPRHLLV